jgi:hypothetical protein
LAFLLSLGLLGRSLFGDDIWMGNHQSANEKCGRSERLQALSRA